MANSTVLLLLLASLLLHVHASNVNNQKVWTADECGFEATMQADLTFGIGYIQGKTVDVLIDYGTKEVGFSFQSPESVCIICPLNTTNFPNTVDEFELTIADFAFKRTAGSREVFTPYVIRQTNLLDSDKHFVLPPKERTVISDLVIEHCMDSPKIYQGYAEQGSCPDNGSCILRDVICRG